MNKKFNETLEAVNSLSFEEQEKLVEIEKKRITEKKRKIFKQDIKEAQRDIKKGNYVTGNSKEVMRVIDDEVKSNKKI